MALTWARALSWRLSRQLLDPVGTGSVVDVVRRLGAVPAWPDAAAETCVGARRTGGRDGDARASLDARQVVKVFTFRGALHLMTPEDAGAYLAVRASARMWELRSWVEYYGLAPADWPAFLDHVREALGGGPLTRSELLESFGRSRRYRHLVPLLADGNDTLLKPLSWQGVMGLGSGRDGEATFVGLDTVPGWTGLPDLDVAGRAVLTDYVRTYGPARRERLAEYVGKGLSAKPRDLRRWLDQLADVLEPVTIEGEEVLVHVDDVDDLRGAAPSTALRLLPGRDPWVMAPGTSDARVVPQEHREPVSRSSNLVVHRGVVRGTWVARRDRLEVTWWPSSGRLPRSALEEQAAGLAAFLGRPLAVDVASDQTR